MANLQFVSFTGIDEKTDEKKLLKISREHQGKVVFGFLCSRSWQENGNRYPNPKTIERFRCLPLCMHLCGQIAKDVALRNDYREFYKLYDYFCDYAQLNIAPYIEDEPWDMKVNTYRNRRFMKRIILQQSSFEQVRMLNFTTTYGLYALIDVSGGTGKEVDFSTMEIPVDYPFATIGFAGGITPDNVVEKVRQIQQIKGLHNYWIDMESGVRTDDWFDTDKVRKVLENLKAEGMI